MLTQPINVAAATQTKDRYYLDAINAIPSFFRYIKLHKAQDFTLTDIYILKALSRGQHQRSVRNLMRLLQSQSLTVISSLKRMTDYNYLRCIPHGNSLQYSLTLSGRALLIELDELLCTLVKEAQSADPASPGSR